MAIDHIGELGTILAVWAHPDDETYLAGGLMSAARANGQRVVCVSATAGELGTADPRRWPPHRLGEVRRAEAVAAMGVLGVQEHEVLGFPDGGLVDDDERGVAAIARLVDEVRPDTVVTFDPTGITYHPDHIAVHHWVTEAWRRADVPPRLLHAVPTAANLRQLREPLERWGVYMGELRPVGVPETALAFALRLDRSAIDQKLAALAAMPSQTAGLLADDDRASLETMLGEEAFVEPATRPVAPTRLVSSA